MVMYFVRFSFINVLDIKFICHLMGKPKVQQNAHIDGPTEWERERERESSIRSGQAEN